MIRVRTQKLKTGTALEDIHDNTAIYAYRGKKLAGLIVHEKLEGWILKIGGVNGSHGFYPTREECIEVGERDFDFAYYTVDEDG